MKLQFDLTSQFRSFAFSGLLVLMLSCSSASKKQQVGGPVQGPQELQGPTEPYGPSQAPMSSGADGQLSPGYGPDPIRLRPLVLVLGPGGAKGFAHVGVIRALRESKIPIGAVLGTEMGALIGSTYALGGNVNQMDFALQRFNEESFRRDPGGLARLVGGYPMENALKRVFGAQDISKFKVATRVTVEMIDSGQPGLIDSGAATTVLRAAMSETGFLGGETKLNQFARARSARETRPFPVLEAKALGIGPVVAIDLGGAPATTQFQLSDADLVLRPNLSHINAEDFSKRTEAIYAGKKLVRDNLREIRRWAGLPEDGR